MTTFVNIEKDANGWHSVATSNIGFYPSHIPAEELSEWVYIPADFPQLENFPFGEIEWEVIEGVQTLTKWMPLPIPPEPEPEPDPTHAITLEERINDLEIAVCELMEILAEAE